MGTEKTARERLELGDRLLRRVRADQACDAAAAAEGVGRQVADKARWLAKVYGADSRRKLESSLDMLTASHLEVAAVVELEGRIHLLQRAANERMSVRQLKTLVAGHSLPHGGSSVERFGTAADLTSARRALEAYAGWDEAMLGRLLDGPNGNEIRALADAGSRLASRLPSKGAASVDNQVLHEKRSSRHAA